MYSTYVCFDFGSIYAVYDIDHKIFSSDFIDAVKFFAIIIKGHSGDAMALCYLNILPNICRSDD